MTSPRAATTPRVYLGTESFTRQVLGQRHRSVVKGKRISCPPQYGHRDPQGVPQRLGERHCFDHRFPLSRSLRASAQQSASVLFSFVLSFEYGRIIHHPAIKNDSSAISRPPDGSASESDRHRDDPCAGPHREDAGDCASAKLQDRNDKRGGPHLNDASF